MTATQATDAYVDGSLARSVVDRAPAHEADPVDALPSGLLDIQDDIARAVVWLAENWSADLPTPRWYGRGRPDRDGEALALLVWCPPGQLARAAGLIDATPPDDEIPNSYGHRYRRVRRSFGTGRVGLEAYHDIADDGEPDR